MTDRDERAMEVLNAATVEFAAKLNQFENKEWIERFNEWKWTLTNAPTYAYTRQGLRASNATTYVFGTTFARVHR